MSIWEKEHLRFNLDEVIWKIEKALIQLVENHMLKLLTFPNYTEFEKNSTP